MKYGLHNAMTAFPVRGNKLFGWLFNLFSKCQDITCYEDKNIVVYDLQIAPHSIWSIPCWIGSHGLVWYDISIRGVLAKIMNLSKEYRTKIYVRVTYDWHYGHKRDEEGFKDIVDSIKQLLKDTDVVLYEAWIENPKGNRCIYQGDDKPDMYEGYWTFRWAREQVKIDWHKFYLLLPLPRLWNNLYKDYWYTLFKRSGKEIFMTDFV